MKTIKRYIAMCAITIASILTLGSMTSCDKWEHPHSYTTSVTNVTVNNGDKIVHYFTYDLLDYDEFIVFADLAHNQGVSANKKNTFVLPANGFSYTLECEPIFGTDQANYILRVGYPKTYNGNKIQIKVALRK